MAEQGSATSTSLQIEKKVKTALKVMQALSPGAAFKYAKKIFFSPIKFPTPEREMHYKHSAAISKEVVDNKSVTLYHVGNAKKSVLLVHGWSGRATQFYKMGPALKQAGYKVYSFTAPAHGSSKEKQTHMLEFTDCIEYFDNKYGPFEAIIAHSIGGAAALNAVKRGVKTKKLVLLGAPGYLKDIIDGFCDRLGLNRKISNKLVQHLKENYDVDYEQFSTTRLAEEMTVPGLIIHDAQDQDVPVEFARENHRAWKNSRYIETIGLGHRLILSDEKVINEVIDFVKE